VVYREGGAERGHGGAPAHCHRSANEFSGIARINRRGTGPYRAPPAQEVKWEVPVPHGLRNG
jgi:hypothetical protein